MPSGAPPTLRPPPSPMSQQDPPPTLPSPPLIRITRTKTPTGGILLGKYQLGRLLGHGSFAKVHEATSIDDSNNVVAIKIIDKTKTVEAALEPRIISEFASGGELFTKVLRRGKLTETTARRYFIQLVSALHFCHQNGVAHRDLVEPAFTAPEVVRRKGYDGSKADAWSCGEFQFPPWISKQVKAIIWQLLDPNPDTRMSLVKLMETSWLKRSLSAYTSLNKEGDSLLHGRKLKHEMERRGIQSMEFEGVMERVKEVGERLGYRVEKGKRGVIGLGKGKVVLTVEVVEIAELFVLVEVKVVEGTVEFEEGRWLDLEAGLGNIFVSWDNHVVG
ncbi:Tetratricopeptide repeat (TPR)-like superfamily protein [Hibiscus syriacus]|uniref:Tetratricopeptide repeat (TPR)-like superfamily protein n=1 Tax=Hibiscus syriacus TaxID=106335 RepID=A0A6A2X5S2_HIBSY|nr:Tetratricopeptide repeat (TPR)-like superfamily protein [Hibiscus syriacus]